MVWPGCLDGLSGFSSWEGEQSRDWFPLVATGQQPARLRPASLAAATLAAGEGQDPGVQRVVRALVAGADTNWRQLAELSKAVAALANGQPPSDAALAAVLTRPQSSERLLGWSTGFQAVASAVAAARLPIVTALLGCPPDLEKLRHLGAMVAGHAAPLTGASPVLRVAEALGPAFLAGFVDELLASNGPDLLTASSQWPAYLIAEVLAAPALSRTDARALAERAGPQRDTVVRVLQRNGVPDEATAIVLAHGLRRGFVSSLLATKVLRAKPSLLRRCLPLWPDDVTLTRLLGRTLSSEEILTELAAAARNLPPDRVARWALEYSGSLPAWEWLRHLAALTAVAPDERLVTGHHHAVETLLNSQLRSLGRRADPQIVLSALPPGHFGQLWRAWLAHLDRMVAGGDERVLRWLIAAVEDLEASGVAIRRYTTLSVLGTTEDFRVSPDAILAMFGHPPETWVPLLAETMKCYAYHRLTPDQLLAIYVANAGDNTHAEMFAEQLRLLPPSERDYFDAWAEEDKHVRRRIKGLEDISGQRRNWSFGRR